MVDEKSCQQPSECRYQDRPHHEPPYSKGILKRSSRNAKSGLPPANKIDKPSPRGAERSPAIVQECSHLSGCGNAPPRKHHLADIICHVVAMAAPSLPEPLPLILGQTLRGKTKQARRKPRDPRLKRVSGQLVQQSYEN